MLRPTTRDLHLKLLEILWFFSVRIKNIEEKDGVIIISTSGYFNNIAGEAVLEIFNEKIDSGSKNFLVDMADSKVVNSIGVSILIEIIEKLDKKG